MKERLYLPNVRPDIKISISELGWSERLEITDQTYEDMAEAIRGYLYNCVPRAVIALLREQLLPNKEE